MQGILHEIYEHTTSTEKIHALGKNFANSVCIPTFSRRINKSQVTLTTNIS